MPEFLSKVRTTVSSLSSEHDPAKGGRGHVAPTDRAWYPGYAAKDSAFETSTQITRDVRIPVGYYGM